MHLSCIRSWLVRFHSHTFALTHPNDHAMLLHAWPHAARAGTFRTICEPASGDSTIHSNTLECTPCVHGTAGEPTVSFLSRREQPSDDVPRESVCTQAARVLTLPREGAATAWPYQVRGRHQGPAGWRSQSPVGPERGHDNGLAKSKNLEPTDNHGGGVSCRSAAMASGCREPSCLWSMASL